MKRTIVLLTVGLTLLLALTAHADPPGLTCGGLAPATPTCSLGTTMGIESLASGLNPGPGYAGTLELDWSWDGGTGHFRCSYDGSPETFVNGGECELVGFPFPYHVPVTTTCSSFDYVTNTPGGNGLWTCQELSV